MLLQPTVLRTGTSPRTRGKPELTDITQTGMRNIPAHAGKTMPYEPLIPSPEEHPRARGENSFVAAYRAGLVGTSPRTRGKPHASFYQLVNKRNIPAHAGKTGVRSRCGYR